MRHSVTVDIETERENLCVELRELTVRDVFALGDDLGDGTLVEDVERMLPRVSNLCMEQIMDMTPRQLETLWTAFKEVNAAFFKIAEALGFGALLQSMQARLHASVIHTALDRGEHEPHEGRTAPQERALEETALQATAWMREETPQKSRAPQKNCTWRESEPCSMPSCA